jgi:hypothetical protein
MISGDAGTIFAEPDKIPDHSWSDGDLTMKFENISLINDSPWSNLVDSELQKVEMILIKYYYTDSEFLNGVKLYFSSGDYVIFLDAGDVERFSINDDTIFLGQSDFSLKFVEA